MEEELCKASDDLYSDNEETLQAANSFLIQQINENPELYQALFNIYNNSSVARYEILSLIMLGLIPIYKIEFVAENLPTFSQLLTNSIIESEDQKYYKFQCQIVFRIVYKIAFQFGESWDGFSQYLEFFQEYNNLTPFCVSLFLQCFKVEKIQEIYTDLFNELDSKISLAGLQYPDHETQIISTKHIIKRISKCEKEEFEAYKDYYYDVIRVIAENSLNMSEYDFNVFWSQFYRLPIEYMGPFPEIAFQFFKEIEGLSPDSKVKLLNILILNYDKIDSNDLENIINTYFELQVCTGGADFKESIFENLSKVDFVASYELLKNKFLAFLTNDDQELQYIGLLMLNSFIKVYRNLINGDISVYLDASLTIGPNSVNNFELMNKYLLQYLRFNKFNYEDTKKLYEFIYTCFESQSDPYMQYLASEILVKIGPNPIYFEKFIAIFEQKPLECLSIYFRFLLYLHSAENNMTDQKYEKFYEFLFQQFSESSKQIDDLYDLYIEYPKNEELADKVYNNILLSNSSSNLIYLFSVYNPIRFSELFKSTNQCFIDLLEKLELGDYETNSFSIFDIKDDFTYVFKIDHVRSKEFPINYHNEVFDDPDIDNLKNYLICLDYSEKSDRKEFINNYIDARDECLFQKPNTTIEDIYYKIEIIVMPLTKWLYKLSEEEIKDLDKKSVYGEKYYNQNQEPVPQIHDFILSMFRFTEKSYEMLILLTKIVKIIVNPKRLNQENAWYNEMCQNLVDGIQKYIENMLPELNHGIFINSFEALSNLMKIFIYTSSDFGHEFLKHYILPFYEKLSESSEISLLNIFSKMIDLNYFNQDEIDVIVQVIKSIIGREEPTYLDSRPSLILLITKLSKLNDEVAPAFIEFVIQTFESVKDDPFLLDVKVPCSYFLLSSFNQDNQQFQCIVPLIPDIISVFPCKKLINNIFEEISLFFENNCEEFNKDLYKVLIHAFVRYLSYQNNALNIFNLSQSSNDELITIFGKLFETYCQFCKIENPEKLLYEILPEQPIVAQYIWSMKQ